MYNLENLSRFKLSKQIESKKHFDINIFCLDNILNLFLLNF